MSKSTVKLNNQPVSDDFPFPIVPTTDLLTDGGTGPNRRIRVDVGQTSFFAGREFRTFKEFSLTSGNTYVIRANVTVDTILNDFGVNLVSGQVKIYTKTGGTQGGTFSETLPIFARNNMAERPTPIYTVQNSLTAGGTHTGGTELDLLWAKTSDNNNFSANVGSHLNAPRGIAIGVYYFIMTALADSTGVLSASWEERI